MSRGFYAGCLMTRRCRFTGLTTLPVVLILLAPQKSRAQSWGVSAPDFSGPVTLVGFVLLIDVGLGVYDLSAAFKSIPPTRGFAIAELVLATPQVILGTVGTVAAIRSNNPAGLLFGTLTLLPIALTIHGIHTLASGRATSEPVQLQSVEDQPDYSTVFDRILIRPSLIAAQTGTAPGLSLAFQF